MTSHQQMTEFLSKHTDKCQLDRLIAELVCAMNVSQPDVSNEALHDLCASLVYKSNLKLAPQDFVNGDEKWPQITTVVHKYGSDLNKHTIDNRN